ncbi:MAG: MFS transporter [Acidipila sp.]|nr:MFS transporter [Acidipila sp.]
MIAPVEAAAPAQVRRLNLSVRVLNAGFVVTGVATTLLGPLLPGLSSRWSLSDAQAGLFFTAQFLGSIGGVALSSALLPSWGYRFTIAAGFVASGAGIAALGLGSWTAGLLSAGIFGMGLGLTISGTNLFVAEASVTRPAAALSLLNLAWGIGAVSCPPLARLALRANRLETFLIFVAGFCALAAGLVAWLLPSQAELPRRRAQELFTSGVRQWSYPFLVSLGALFFLYVGTENSLAGWAASFAKRLGTTAELSWAITPSYFWGALVAGRAAAPVILRHVSEKIYVLGGLAVTLVSSAAMLGASSSMQLTLSLGAAGLGLAAIFPILVTWLWEGLGVSSRRLGGLMFTLAGLGGAAMPWLVGLESTRSGSLQKGLIIPLAALVAMMILVRPATHGLATRVAHTER